MATRAGGHYGAAFKGNRGVTQGDPLSPTIFNVVVDALVRHWVSVTAEGAEERGGYRKEGIHQNPLLYAYNVMVPSSDPQWIQGAFSTLVGIFDWVGLWTNVRKTYRMVYRPCQAAGTQTEAAYERQTKGEVPSYREQQRGRVQHKEYGEDMALGSLAGHIHTQHGRVEEGRWSW